MNNWVDELHRLETSKQTGFHHHESSIQVMQMCHQLFKDCPCGNQKQRLKPERNF